MATALLLGIVIAIQILLAANINQIRKIIMATKEQVMAGLGNIETELGKIGTETQTLIAKVAELQQAANNAGNIPDEVMDKINAVATQARVVDDLVPDATELPPAPTPDPAPASPDDAQA